MFGFELPPFPPEEAPAAAEVVLEAIVDGQKSRETTTESLIKDSHLLTDVLYTVQVIVSCLGLQETGERWMLLGFCRSRSDIEAHQESRFDRSIQ